MELGLKRPDGGKVLTFCKESSDRRLLLWITVGGASRWCFLAPR